ncbi:MAG: type restriction protein res subunit [Myxococcaceae bacterium]|nr:type restriction protein res subunit [Myxococcaceae bacterium]
MCWKKFSGTFETLWADPEFERYDPHNETDRSRLASALGAERGSERLTTLFELRPFPFQEEILDRLTVARVVHGRRRNLIVAATGTGKTVVAAVDYARIAAAAGVTPRLLFLAHRREILEKSRDTFRHALRDAAFGELLVGGSAPARFEHVFATIASARAMVDKLGLQHFTHVVVDECHHMPADSYQALVPRLQPEQLVGLTATPERSDGKSLLPDFEGHIAAELRLWHALERQLLAPFDYYGISDGVDLRKVRWSRNGYDLNALGNIYTGHDARAQLVLAQLARRVANVARVRALGFCVSVAHADFMAAAFCAQGVPALSVHGGSDAALRADAPRRLRERDVNVLFTCDLYNEGIDLPFVDTLLLLRPTMSATLFIQQLGRGLRLDPASGKSSCLVLDFIGQHREEFRFDKTLFALTGVPRAALREAVREGFPYLPSGCSVQLDAVARETILTSLRATLAGVRRLGRELRELEAHLGEPIRLGRFLEESGRELHEVYGKDYGWAAIRREAGVASDVDDETADLSRRLGWLSHVDEPTRLRSYSEALGQAVAAGPLMLSDADRIRWHMLDFQLNHVGTLRTAEETVAEIRQRPAVVAELAELREVLEERTALAEDVYPVADWPLALHRHYQRREIVAAVGFVQPGAKGKVPQGGILKLPELRHELLFVTLNKSGSGFSPTTRYRDYAISSDRFHWETQAAASLTRESGKRYVNLENGWSFYLFVRAEPGAAYAFLGRVRYLSHSGDRPIGITWALDAPMPAALFEQFASLAAG